MPDLRRRTRRVPPGHGDRPRDGRSFFADHDSDLVAPAYETILALVDVDEGLRSADPLEYELAWTFEDETLRVRFDDAPTIVGTERA